MRFSTASVLLALPLLAAAQEGFDQYKAQFQNFLGQFGSYLPSPNKQDPVGAAEAKAGAMKMNVLTLDNWKDTLYGSVEPDATTPEEWWVLITGRNKSCFGHCLKVENAFNQTAARLAVLPDAPHVGLVNCDNQPILCNTWSAGAGTLWMIEMLPRPAPINIYMKRMNLTTTDADAFMEVYRTRDNKSQFRLKEGWFHPFDGLLANLGVANACAYLLWGLSSIPSWGMMLIVSFISRSMMNRRMMQNDGRPGAAAGAAGARPRGAPPGDAAGPR